MKDNKKLNKLLYVLGVLAIVALIGYALMQEIVRNERQIGSGISGTIHLAPGVGAGIVKTDNALVYLLDPTSYEPKAIAVINPFVPPIAFYVGQQDAVSAETLQGEYRLLVITDKNGRTEVPVPGEFIGPISQPIALGTEQVDYTLTEPFRQIPTELRRKPAVDASQLISGTIKIAPELKANVEETDRLVIMLFDPKLGRPAAFKFIPHVIDGQTFSIGQPDAMQGAQLQGPFSLRILTDKNNKPFQAAPGEIVGRSTELIDLGTEGIILELNQPYVR